MKKKRPLITKHDMRKLVSTARRKHASGHAVRVQPMLREFYPGRKITNQMRRLVSVELDKAGITRLHREDIGELNKDRSKPQEPIPGVLGGMTAESLVEMKEKLDEDYQDSLGESLDELNAKVRRQDELDLCLSHLADDGNIRAHVLLMHRLGVR